MTSLQEEGEEPYVIVVGYPPDMWIETFATFQEAINYYRFNHHTSMQICKRMSIGCTDKDWE